MKFFLLFLFLGFIGCATNQITIQNNQKIILESGVKIVIKNKNVLPFLIHYQNKTFKITKDKNGKIIVKNVGMERKKSPFNNY